jgi:hypothetical protein
MAISLADVAIQPLIAGVIADLGDHPPRQLIEVDLGACGDLTQQQHKTGFGCCLAGDARGGILLQAGVHHRIADLVADLVRVAFSHRLRGEHQAG